jgi:hypothetical protein
MESLVGRKGGNYRDDHVSSGLDLMSCDPAHCALQKNVSLQIYALKLFVHIVIVASSKTIY